ncbi:hypothetical protein P154DRAFT_346728 [Amniculicola lignicola CBS 123094]|uniref:Uncharacterized protein n=1 Tax=Amniculicola lignicola CBS 123094 TaxID=1392246 RepID=A0A6A5W2B4_9PLEO|nr:hypothetical protein P154DRAFT_346728 [Amniculicola lignicola CBS 123094]
MGDLVDSKLAMTLHRLEVWRQPAVKGASCESIRSSLWKECCLPGNNLLFANHSRWFQCTWPVCVAKTVPRARLLRRSTRSIWPQDEMCTRGSCSDRGLAQNSVISREAEVGRRWCERIVERRELDVKLRAGQEPPNEPKKWQLRPTYAHTHTLR